MKNKKVLCCDFCFEKIAKKNSTAASLWLDLCELQDTCYILGVMVPDNHLLHLLETMGFITTTETEDMLLMKVHGKEEEYFGSFFCGGLCGRRIKEV